MKTIANARDALYGESHDADTTDLVPRYEVEISVTTEVPNGPVHSAFFNRGSVATQEYARRFENHRQKVVRRS